MDNELRKRIIVLRGISNSGKTTKINKVLDWIIKTYDIENTVGLNLSNWKIDTCGVLRIGNLMICVNSTGDNKHEILNKNKRNV